MDPVLLASLILGVAIVGAALAVARAVRAAPNRPQAQATAPGASPAPSVSADETHRLARIEADAKRRDSALRDALAALSQRVATLEAELEHTRAALRDARQRPDHTPAPPVVDPPLSVSPHGTTPMVSVSGSLIEPLPRPRRPREEIAADIRRLLGRGRNALEIAQLLDIDVGEVELVLQLDRAAILRERRPE